MKTKDLWGSIDLSSSIKSYEYTRHVKYQIHQALSSDDFAGMDARSIFEFVYGKMDIVLFNDYLKRFIYQRAQIGIPFDDVTDKDYISIIRQSFFENSAPASFKSGKTNISSAARLWLKSESPRRNAIFLLGFGLGMDDSEVHDFLTKALKEESFRFSDPFETIAWFCFHNGHPYSKALELMAYYDGCSPDAKINESLWDAMKHSPKMYIYNEKELRTYLQCIKTTSDMGNALYEEYFRLHKKLQELIAENYNLTNEDGPVYEESDITPMTIERILYLETPREKSGNLKKMSASVLSKQFANKRMNRDHIIKVLHKKVVPDRYDLLTILFYLYANSIYYGGDSGPDMDENIARFRDFLDEANAVLKKCGMAGVYPVNPYEAFLLLCLLSDDPMEAYYDVWKYSFQKGENS